MQMALRKKRCFCWKKTLEKLFRLMMAPICKIMLIKQTPMKNLKRMLQIILKALASTKSHQLIWGGLILKKYASSEREQTEQFSKSRP